VPLAVWSCKWFGRSRWGCSILDGSGS